MLTEAQSPLIDAATFVRRLAVDPTVVVLDARPDAAAYMQGHLPHAQHADLETQLSAAQAPDADPRNGGRHPLPVLADWCAQLGTWGIAAETAVVVYDAQAGANAAARAWWMLRAVGHRAVQVLDGGLPAALAAGLTLTRDLPTVRSRPPYPAAAWQWPQVGIEDVARCAGDADWCVLDVRAAERYRGETEPIDPVAGHIPGAVNLPFADNLDDGRFADPERLHARYRRLLDGRDPRHLIVHCGSGVTACHSLLALEHAGLPGASLYVGSWSEWCRSGRPLGTATA
jgi:thiosulfate/3-mercaptopyruvate sulfurtransferase